MTGIDEPLFALRIPTLTTIAPAAFKTGRPINSLQL